MFAPSFTYDLLSAMHLKTIDWTYRLSVASSEHNRWPATYVLVQVWVKNWQGGRLMWILFSTGVIYTGQLARPLTGPPHSEQDENRVEGNGGRFGLRLHTQLSPPAELLSQWKCVEAPRLRTRLACYKSRYRSHKGHCASCWGGREARGKTAIKVCERWLKFCVIMSQSRTRR